MTRHIGFYVLALAIFLLSVSSCRQKVEMTSIQIEDSVRHYYPVAMGQHMQLQYNLMNIGEHPLIITDIQPSCGCIVTTRDTRVVPPGDWTSLIFSYHSEKNVGYVHHTIRLYGNIAPKGLACCIFDVNVVPSSYHHPDYEELYREWKEKQGDIQSLVDGTESEKGYFLDDQLASHKRFRKYPWRKE